MVTVPMDCPHCHTERVAFTGTHWMWCDSTREENILLLQCACCFNGIIAKYRGKMAFLNWIQSDGKSQPPLPLDVWPKAEPPSAPKHLPDNIRSFFLQGLDSLRRKGFDAAGSMFRKSLDVALKHIHPEGKGTLQKRINILPPELGITPTMKEWAHEIRDLGNEAAHEEKPFTEAEARALHAYTEMFLTYAFTMPGMMRERKEQEPPVKGPGIST